MLSDETNIQKWRRTPPGVRELKRKSTLLKRIRERRTPPGVRELKLVISKETSYHHTVAPLPGCVN